MFSILIPTWNNLPYLQLCIESIRRHSAFEHEIIVHVNEGTDGTLEWVRAQGCAIRGARATSASASRSTTRRAWPRMTGSCS